MRFIVKKRAEQFLSVYMIPQIIIKIFYIFFFQPNKRMSGKSINFEDKKINKSTFKKKKKLSSKYFIGYNDDDVIRPLCIKLPQVIGYVKCFQG